MPGSGAGCYRSPGAADGSNFKVRASREAGAAELPASEIGLA
jgi:hypothetical protein